VSSNRIKESELIVPALEAANEKPDGTIETSELIDRLEKQFSPSGEDADVLYDRNDTKFSQKVRNLISHKDCSTSMFAKGWATYDPSSHAITITDQGKSFLLNH